MKVVLRLENGILYPASDDSADILNAAGSGHFSVDIKKARSPGFHRYAMKMLRVMHDMIDEEVGFDPWRRLLTVKAGYFQAVGHSDGSVMVVPDSLSFERMDEQEFKECWNNIHQAFVDKYGKSLTQNQLNEWAGM